MIFEVFGTQFTFLLDLLQNRTLVNLPQVCSFSAHLPKFNPATPKLQELGENYKASRVKLKK